jgi:hypothetical protein
MVTSTHGAIVSDPPEIPSTPATAVSARTRPRKKLVRRIGRDYSQSWRRSFQFLFLAWNVYLGGLFYQWVRHYETGASTRAIARPAGVEGWLPIAGMMNLKYWLVSGHVSPMHPAAMFLLITFLSI